LKTSAPDIYQRICSLTLQIKEKTKLLKTNYRLIGKKKHPFFAMVLGIFGLILGLPLFIYGFLFNFVFLQIPNIQIKKIQDVQFHSSIIYSISLLLAIVLLPLYLILCFALIAPWWLAITVFVSIPIAGLFAWNYHLLFRRIIGGLRIRHMIRTKNEDILLLRQNYDELVSLISKV
jgi:hypothetical protein